MVKRLVVGVLFVCLAFAGIAAFAGDSSYGRVAEVRSANVLLMDFGKFRNVVRLAGIVPPTDRALANEARAFVEQFVRGKGARMRVEGRNKEHEMIARVLVDDPQTVVKDLGTEIVRAGLARAERTTAYKYHELEIAEESARKEGRGIWARTQPQPTVQPQPRPE
jgi:endonuclease YncB( thermonuclease family)